MPDEIQVEPCIHACSMGCGRKYDAILVQVVDGSTLFLCMPDLMALAANIMKSMVEADDPAVREVVAGADFTDIAYVNPTTYSGAAVTAGVAPAEDEFDLDSATAE